MRSNRATDPGSLPPAGRVLVVEDDPDNAQLVTFILTRAGFEVDHHVSPLAALVEVEAGGYDLLLTDLRLPDMDGVELAQRARDIEADLPVVLMTAHASSESSPVADRISVSALLRKPLRAVAVLDAVSHAISSRPAPIGLG